MSGFTTLWDGFVFGLGFAFAYCLVETLGKIAVGVIWRLLHDDEPPSEMGR